MAKLVKKVKSKKRKMPSPERVGLVLSKPGGTTKKRPKKVVEGKPSKAKKVAKFLVTGGLVGVAARAAKKAGTRRKIKKSKPKKLKIRRAPSKLSKPKKKKVSARKTYSGKKGRQV